MFSLGSYWQYDSIGSDNGLVPYRRQAFSEAMLVCCTDAYMRHSASKSYGVKYCHTYAYVQHLGCIVAVCAFDINR